MLSAALQPPDQSASNDQQNGNQLRSRHQPAKHFAAPWIVAQELDEVTLDSVQDHKCTPHLPIEFLSTEQPGQQQEVEKLGGGFDQLCRFNSDAERSSADGIRQRIREDHAPEVTGRLAVTATRRETTEASEDVAEGKPRGEAIGGTQDRHVMAAH